MINPPRNNMEGVGAAVSLQRAESPFFFLSFGMEPVCKAGKNQSDPILITQSSTVVQNLISPFRFPHLFKFKYEIQKQSRPKWTRGEKDETQLWSGSPHHHHHHLHLSHILCSSPCNAVISMENMVGCF